MVALNFNAQQVQPSYGSDSGLPDGKYKTVIVNTEKKDKADAYGNVSSSYLEITHAVVEGPLNGQKMIDRLTLLHASADVVRIANQQLSAYCHVLGVYQFNDTAMLHNKPMMIEVGRQLDKNTKQPMAYGEIKKIFDANGNEAGKAAQNNPVQQTQPQHQPQSPPPAGVQADGAGWGGQPQQQPQQQGGFGAQPDPNAGQPQGGFGQPQPPQDQGQGGNWGGPAGGAPQQPQQPQQAAQGGGWAPGGAAGGAGPAWGAR